MTTSKAPAVLATGVTAFGLIQSFLARDTNRLTVETNGSKLVPVEQAGLLSMLQADNCTLYAEIEASLFEFETDRGFAVPVCAVLSAIIDLGGTILELVGEVSEPPAESRARESKGVNEYLAQFMAFSAPGISSADVAAASIREVGDLICCEVLEERHPRTYVYANGEYYMFPVLNDLSQKEEILQELLNFAEDNPVSFYRDCPTDFSQF